MKNKQNNICCHCMYSEGIEGRNSIIGCNLDKKLHDMDDSCLCFQSVYRFNTETGLPERIK